MVRVCINPRRFVQQKCVFVHVQFGGMCQNFDAREPSNAETKDVEHLLIGPETDNLNEIICLASKSEVYANVLKAAYTNGPGNSYSQINL